MFGLKRLGDLTRKRRHQLFTLSNLAIAQVMTILLGLAGSLGFGISGLGFDTLAHIPTKALPWM
jgi:hypothetical protein